MSERNQEEVHKNHAAQGIDQSTIRDLSDLALTDANRNLQSQLGQIANTDIGGRNSRGSGSRDSQVRDKASSSHQKNRMGNMGPQGNGHDPTSLFPDISSMQQPDRASAVTHSSVQRKSVHGINSPPGTAEAQRRQAQENQFDVNVQNGHRNEVPMGSTGTRRQLSNINVNQRMSHSQTNQPIHQQQVAHGDKIDNMVNQQNYQHQAYISRQNQAHQQIMTQSIGDASNASYVFDGVANQPVTRGDKSQFGRNGQGHTQGGGRNLVDNRSVSNESSPSSKFGRRNFMYKNVRNFNNLYENRSLASKNIEMQDQLRLGGAEKLWNFRRVDALLPQLYDTGNQSSMLQNQNTAAGFLMNNQGLDNNDSMLGVSGMTQMKRIKRTVMDDGTNQPKLELRQSPISNEVIVQKPGTHNGYQSTHYNGKLAHTDPKDKHNMTSNSFNDSRQEESYLANTMPNSFVPELSISSNFYLDGQINMLKPILRRNCLHNRNNIVIQWKSFEIWTVKMEFEGGHDSMHNKLVSQKILNPVYVPLTELNHLLTLTESQIELRVVKSLKIGPNGKQFLYVPIEIPTAGSDLQQADDDLSRKHSLNSPAKLQPSSPRDGNWADNATSPTRSTKLKSTTDNLDQSFGGSSANNMIPLEDKMSEEIHTSLYLQQLNTDFGIIIRPPCVEYSIPSRNFQFMKTLTREENNEFISNRFNDWQAQAIKCLTRYSKFNELLSIVEKGQDYKLHLARMEAQRYQEPKGPSAIHQPSKRKRSHMVKRQIKNAIQDAIVNKRDSTASTSASSMQVYVLELKTFNVTGKIIDYQSINDFKQSRFLPSSQTEPHGCFNQNNAFGTIDVKPFAVSVKGLDTDYEYRWEYRTPNWEKLVGFMQNKCMKQPDNPKQLVDKICKIFLTCIKRATLKGEKHPVFDATSIFVKKDNRSPDQRKPGHGLKNYPLLNEEGQINERVNELAQLCISEPSKTVQKLTELRNNNQEFSKSSDQAETEKQQIPQQQSKDSIEQQRKRFVQDSKRALSQFLTLQNRSKMLAVPNTKPGAKENSVIRYLIEFEFPVCQVSYQGQSYTKTLTEEDLVLLVSRSFCRWKNYLMTKHFRLELNIGNEKPLPRILEDKRGEDDLISETDPRDKFPITEAEKPKIEQTRAQVTNWFGV